MRGRVTPGQADCNRIFVRRDMAPESADFVSAARRARGRRPRPVEIAKSGSSLPHIRLVTAAGRYAFARPFAGLDTAGESL